MISAITILSGLVWGFLLGFSEDKILMTLTRLFFIEVWGIGMLLMGVGK